MEAREDRYDANGTVLYTGTSRMHANRRIELVSLTEGPTTSIATFWIDRMDEELPGHVVTLTIEVRVWHTTDTAPSATSEPPSTSEGPLPLRNPESR
ncbi:hypothetical protein [Nocardia sp. NPDC050710]|uniref:hypothetical protein n=1 Tax=Nocardia sp. NPDC050710 TaxID=3157220 RepID=UPI0033F879FD